MSTPSTRGATRPTGGRVAGRLAGRTVNVCAGPGGIEMGARILGLDPMIGVELDDDACATGRAAGFERQQHDMRLLSPKRHRGVTGAVITPPCPGFSAGGKGLGSSRPASAPVWNTGVPVAVVGVGGEGRVRDDRPHLRMLGLCGLTVREVEDGIIPMTDAPFTQRPSPRVIRLGTAGGATRPSTGYTFSAMRRQAREIADASARGAAPIPAAPYPRRHLWMDAVALRAWDAGLVSAPEFYDRLFARNPTTRVLRFLDGLTTPYEDLALMRSTPLAAMTRAAAGDTLARVSTRTRAGTRTRAPSH